MILIRHGQSHFNVHFGATREDPGIIDPGLTEEGITQAREAGRALLDHDVRRIVASPYSRTLETAELIADQLGLPVTVDPLVRERAYFTCDIGSPRSHLASRWPEFEFGDMAERWWPDMETETELFERCSRFRAASSLLEDWRHMLVVTHWGFIRGLTGQEVKNAAVVPYDLTVA
jgi:broad specificity phosphatase PhoE